VARARGRQWFLDQLRTGKPVSGELAEDLVATLFDQKDRQENTVTTWPVKGAPSLFPPAPHSHSQYLSKGDAGQFLTQDDAGRFIPKEDEGRFLTEEADPVFGASPARGITVADIARWNLTASTEQLQAVIDALNALSERETTLSGDASGIGAAEIPVTVTGLQGQTIPSPTAGFLRWTGSTWAFVEGSLPESLSLGDLSDVTTSSVSEGDRFEFSSGEWVNKPGVQTFVQAGPSTGWVVPNPFGRPPVGVTVLDSSGQSIGCKVEHDTIDWSFFTVTHTNAISGTVTFY